MRKLTKTEIVILSRMCDRVGPMLRDRHETVGKFLADIGLKLPYEAHARTQYLRAACAWTAKVLPQHPDSREVQFPLAYLFADTLAQRLRGRWILYDDPDSDHFGHPMIGELAGYPGRCVSPFDIVNQYLDDVLENGPMVSVAVGDRPHYETTRGGTIRTLLARISDVENTLRNGEQAEAIEWDREV